MGEKIMDPKTELSVNFHDIHVIAREIVALRQVIEMQPNPEVQKKITKLQELAATAQSAAMRIQRDCDGLSRQVAELENQLGRMSDSNNVVQQYPAPLEDLEMCHSLTEEDYLLVFRDTAGSRLTLRLRSEAIPHLLEKLAACQ
jgi:DNA repair ATPase RecN